MTSMHTLINCSRVTNIRVRGFSSSEVLTIDTAYSRDFIPADRSHIPVNETAKAFRHLLPIVDKLQPLQSCEVGLLIGYNCPEALAPRKTIVGPVNQPYAVETVLGLSIVGYSHDSSVDMNVVGSTSNRTSVKELPPCLPRDLIKVLEKDFAHDKPQDIKYSQEDILFLNYMKEGIYQQEDKHMNMPLPFKERPVLPNNRSSALVRLEHLKRKFVRDMKYKDDYVKFMNDVIERNFAEPVGDNAEEGRTQQENLPLASHFIQHDFYVDDGLTSVQTEQDAIKLVCDAQQLCANGGLRLHKFISNSLNVIRSIPPSERASDMEIRTCRLTNFPRNEL